jgi:hypothetical protein
MNLSLHQRRGNTNHLDFIERDAIYRLLRHCEAKLKVCLKSIQLRDVTSPKQSPLIDLAANSAQGDCFVALVSQRVENVSKLWIFPTYASRNDEPKRKFGMTRDVLKTTPVTCEQPYL